MSVTAVQPKVREHPPWLGAAMMAVTITHPIDQTKMRAQTQRLPLSMIQTASNTIRTSGVSGLWTGLTGSLLRQATYGAARFGVYAELNENGKRRRKAKGLSEKVPTSQLVLNGAIAGAVAGLVGAPGDGVKPVEKRVNYRNAIHGLYRVYNDQGLRSVFHGGEATILRSVLMNSTQLACYDVVKAQLLSTGYFKDSVPLHLLTASIGGTISVTICAPVDVMKSRIQSSTKPSLQIISESLRREGASVLFRGWLPAWLRMIPTTTLTFAFIEQLKKIF